MTTLDDLIDCAIREREADDLVAFLLDAGATIHIEDQMRIRVVLNGGTESAFVGSRLGLAQLLKCIRDCRRMSPPGGGTA